MQNGDELECKVTLVNVPNEKRWLAYHWVELLTKNTSETYIWHYCQEVCKNSTILMTNIMLIKRAKGLWQSYFIKCHWMWHLDIGHWIWQYEWLAGLGSSYHRCWRQPIFCFIVEWPHWYAETESGLVVCMEKNLAKCGSVSRWRFMTQEKRVLWSSSLSWLLFSWWSILCEHDINWGSET